MNKPKYFRLLEKGEKLQSGDCYEFYGGGSTSIPAAVGVVGEGGRDSVYFRPVQVDEWVSYAERKPTEEDFGPTGWIDYIAGNANNYPYQCNKFGLGDAVRSFGLIFWRRITPPEQPKPKSVNRSE